MKFNLGEKVKVIHDYYAQYRSNSIVDHIGILVNYYTNESPYLLDEWSTQGENRYKIRLDDNQECQEYLVREQDLIREGSYDMYYQGVQPEQKNKGIIMKLNSMMKRLLNADVKKLIKAGFMNGDLLLTEEGKNAIYALLVETHKKELVEIAKEIIEEQKEENN